MQKYIYVCSPYGASEENYKAAIGYAQFVVGKGHTPIVPHVMYHSILNDKISKEREMGLNAGLKLLTLCDELWVFTKVRTPGMRGEIEKAQELGIEIVDISSEQHVNLRSAEFIRAVRYCERAFTVISCVAYDDISDYIDAGITAAVIEEAIKAAVRKGARWNYARAILERCKHSGILTLEQYNFACKAKAAEQNYNASYNLDAFTKMINAQDD